MLILLALPVIVTVAAVHRYLALYAPTNVLVCRVRGSHPTRRAAAALAVVACVCAGGVRLLNMAIEAGAPGWLNVVVLVLAWDAIKVGFLALSVLLRASLRGLRAKTHGSSPANASAPSERLVSRRRCVA